MDRPNDATEVVVLLLPDLVTAWRAREDLFAAHGAGRFGFTDLVVVDHQDGRVRLHQSGHGGPVAGAAAGSLLGALAGVFLGSVVAPALLGGAVGGVLAGLRDRGLRDEDVRRIGTGLVDGEAAVLVLADPVSARIIADEVAAVGTVRHFELHADDAAAVRSVAAQVHAGGDGT